MPPSNDDFANALDLGVGSSGSNYSVKHIETATVEVGEPTGSQLTNGIHATVWYKWTCPADGWYDFNTVGSPTPNPGLYGGPDGCLNTTMAVWTDPGGGLTSLIEVGSNDDDIFDARIVRYGMFPLTSRVVICGTIGQVYYIQVGTYDVGYLGDINLHWMPAVGVQAMDSTVTNILNSDVTGAGDTVTPVVSGVYNGRLYFIYTNDTTGVSYAGSCFLDGTDFQQQSIPNFVPGAIYYQPGSTQQGVDMCFDGLNVYFAYSWFSTASGPNCAGRTLNEMHFSVNQFDTAGHTFTEIWTYVEIHDSVGGGLQLSASPNFSDYVHLVYSIYTTDREDTFVACPCAGGTNVDTCVETADFEGTTTVWYRIRPSLGTSDATQSDASLIFTLLRTASCINAGTINCAITTTNLGGTQLPSAGFRNSNWFGENNGRLNSDQGYPVIVGFAPDTSYGNTGADTWDMSQITVYRFDTLTVLGTISMATIVPAGLIDDLGAPLTAANFFFNGGGVAGGGIIVSDTEVDIETSNPTRWLVVGVGVTGGVTLFPGFAWIVAQFQSNYLTYINPPFSGGSGFETTALYKTFFPGIPYLLIKDVMATPPPCSSGYNRRALWGIGPDLSGNFDAMRWNNRCFLGWDVDNRPAPPTPNPPGNTVFTTWSSDVASQPIRYAMAGSELVAWDVIRDGFICVYNPPLMSVFWFYAGGQWRQQNVDQEYSLYHYAEGAWHQQGTDPDYELNANLTGLWYP